MKKRINSSILAATSLTAAITYHQQTLASSLVLSTQQLKTLSPQNSIQADNVTKIDFRNITPEIVAELGNITIDLSNFQTVRDIVLPWYASSLNIKLPSNFGIPINDSYSHIKIINGNTSPSTDKELNLNLNRFSNFSGKIILDVSETPIITLQTGLAVAKLIRGTATTNLTIADSIESIETSGVIADDVRTYITLLPSVEYNLNSGKPLFQGFPTAVLGSNPNVVDISNYRIDGQDVVASGITKLEQLKTSSGENIGTLKVTGEKEITLNSSVNKVEFTSSTPDQIVVDTLSSVATVVAPSARDAHIGSFIGKTDLDFSKLDLGSVDNTATRIKEIFDNSVPVESAVSIKISASVLAAVMSKMNITNLSSFTALKRLEIISPIGEYQAFSLASSDLPSGLEEYYSSTLVVRRGSLTETLTIDKKFAAATIDLSGLNRNGQSINLSHDYNNSQVSTIKLNTPLLSVAALKNLIGAGANKTIIVSGAAGGALTTANLQNVDTIDLRLVTGATSFATPIYVEGNNSNLSKLYLPLAFDVEASADILSGVDNGEVTIYLSGAYSGAKTMDASYDKTILNFSAITGTGRFRLPSGIRGLVLSDNVKGLNVGAAAVTNEFDLSALTHLRQLTDLPTSATTLKLNNSSASSSLSLNLLALNDLTTLHLNSSKVSSITLPASENFTNGGEGHLNLSLVTQLKELNHLNEMLAQGGITTITFPNNPAPDFHIDIADANSGITFNNLDKVPHITMDSAYLSKVNMWPTVKSKSLSSDWSKFFNYIMGSVGEGGLNSPTLFDLSGQLVQTQTEADALVVALNGLSQANKSIIQKIIVRLSASANGTIDFSRINTSDFSHGSLKVVFDNSTGSSASVSVPAEWSSKSKVYKGLAQINKENANEWGQYLNYHFASLNDKGEASISLDLSEITLSAAEWSSLMSALNSYGTPADIESIHIKLASGNAYTAPAFTTASFSSATSIIIDITGVKNAGSQISVTGLPTATINLQVEQRVNAASSVDRSSAASWKGYIEHLLANIGGTNYTLDLTAAYVQIATTDQLTKLSTALEGLSAANKGKIENIILKIATGNRSTDFTVSTNLENFDQLETFILDATGALNGFSQSTISFNFTNEPMSLSSKTAHVTSLALVDTDNIASWNYYIAYRKYMDEGLVNLDLSSVTMQSMADVSAFLHALNTQVPSDKSTLQSLKIKLASNFSDNNVDFSIDLGDGELSGLDHASFAVEVDRNGANSTAPITVIYGTAINATNTTIRDSAFTSLGSFDGTNAHHWLGYIRTLLGTLSAGTTTLDLSNHSALEMNSAALAKFITAMNALPDSDKAKVAILKIKLATGDFGYSTANLSTLDGFTSLTGIIVERNGARVSSTLNAAAVAVNATGSVTLIDPELRSVSNKDRTNEWLGYIRFILNGIDVGPGTVDLSNFEISSANEATALNNALNSLPASEKQKISTLKVAASASVTLGTDISGLTNLETLVIDQTAAPTAAVTFASGFGTTQKSYVTSAAAAQSNAVWNKYVDYVLSSTANGGLQQTSIDLSSLELTSTNVGDLFYALNGHASAGSITDITVKLAGAFGAASLDLSSYTNLVGLNNDGVVIYRNGASNSGSLVSITYGGSFTDAKVRIIDPTVTSISNTAEASQWLGYIIGILNDAATGVTLDLSTIAIDDAAAVTAVNSALACLDSSLADKIGVFKLNITHAANITLGSNTSGFSALTRIEYTKPVGNTVSFAGAFNGKRLYLTDFTRVKMDSPADWSHYLNYMLSTTDSGQSATSLNLNSRSFADQTAVNNFFSGLDMLNNAGVYADKSVLTTLRMTLADGQNAISIGGSVSAATGLNPNLRIIVNPGTSTGTTHAGKGAGQVQATQLIVLSSTPAFSKQHIAYLVEQNGFNGTIDLTGLSLDWSTGTNTLIQELNLLATNQMEAIKTINLKLQSGNFGSSQLTLGALAGGFTGVTFNIDRNGALDGATTYGPLVIITNNTGHTVNLTDGEFHNMSTFNNESSAHWIGYLTHELNSAPANYTLDLTISSALHLDSTNSVSAFSHALRYLPDNLKTKVATLKVRSSTNGDFGATDWGGPGPSERVIPEYAAFDKLNTVVLEYTATGLNIKAHVGHLTDTAKYAYVPTLFNSMDWNDWRKYFNYELNPTNIGGRSQTSLSIDKRLSSADLTALLAGLNAADAKASLTDLTLNLKSDVVGDINVGASDLTTLNTVVINTNGSAAKLTPTNSFIGKTSFSSINNVKTDAADSWAAYLAGQSSIEDIDIREVELTDQANLSAFLTALNADGQKATVETIKLKLAANYTDPINFNASPATGLTAITNSGVEVHRNGSTSSFTQGGSITNAKIKIIDPSASSLTDRTSPSSWLAYLNALIDNGGFAGSIDLSLDPDTYVRTNAQLTALMNGINNLSPANKLLVTSLKIQLSSAATWSNITNLGQGLTGFTNLTSLLVDVTGAYTNAGGNPQATVAFHADVSAVSTKKAIVTNLASVDKDSASSWTYYFNTGAMTTVDVSSTTLNSTEATAFLSAIGTGVTAKSAITAVTMKLDSSFGSGSLNINGDGFHATATAFTVQRNGAAYSGDPVEITLSNPTGSSSLSIVDPTLSEADSVLKTSASSWLAYLTDALSGGPTDIDLSDDNLVLGTQGQANALSTALDALDPSLKEKVQSLKLKASVSVTIGAALNSAGGFTLLSSINMDKPAANSITVNNVDSGTQFHIADLAKVNRTNSAEWEYYLNYITRNGAAALDLSGTTLTTAELSALNTALNTFSTADGNGNKLSSIHIKVSGAAGASTVNISANLDAQTAINTAAEFIVDITGFTHNGTQAIVNHTGGTPKSIELRSSGHDNLYRDSASSWAAYFNAMFPIGIPITTNIDFTLFSNTYLRNQTDVDALMSAIESRSDKGNINILNVRLAPGDVGSDITFGTGVTGINPTMSINIAGASNNGVFLSSSDIRYAGSFTSTGKTVADQTFASSLSNQASQSAWTAYLTYLLSDPSEGGLGRDAIVAPPIANSAELSAFMGGVNGLSNELKDAIQHIHLDVSADNSLSTLGTGVSDLNNLQQVTYIRSTGVGGAMEAGSFVGKLQRVRTAWDANAISSAANVEAYLRYVLMDDELFGLEQSLLDLTGQTLTTTQAGYLNTALGSLPDELSFRITEIRVKLNAADLVTFDAAGLRNLSTVKYFQTGADSGGVGFGSATKIRFRETIVDVTNKTDSTQWSEYINYVTTSVNAGGLGQTTLDISSAPLSNDQKTNFFAALSGLPNNQRLGITTIKLAALDNTMGNFDGGNKAYNNNLKIILIMDNFTNGTPTLSMFNGQKFFAANGITELVAEDVLEYRLTVQPAVTTATSTEWQRWLNQKLSSTMGGEGATTIDLNDSTMTRAQLSTFMTGLNAVDNSLLSNLTSLKLRFNESGSTALTLTGNGGKTFNTNLVVTVTTDNDYSGTIDFDGLLSGGSRVLREFVTTAPAVTALATTWRRFINYQLTSVANGGAEVTTIDLSGTHQFASQAQLNEFFAGLQALTGSGGNANKNVLTDLTLKLTTGNFGSSSASVAAAVTNLNSNINVTIHRNGAQNGTFSFARIVFINLSSIATSGAKTIVDNESLIVNNLSSTPDWLAYLNRTLTEAGSGYDLDLTDASTGLANPNINNQAQALFSALEALNTNLKAKIATIKLVVKPGIYGAGALSLSGTLTSAAGFTALTRIIVDVTLALIDVSGTQKIIDLSGVSTSTSVKKVMWVNALNLVDFDSANATDSWLAYINYITRTGTASLDTSTVNSGNGLTVAQVGYLLNALEKFSAANDNANRLTSVLIKLSAAPGSDKLIVNQDFSNLSGLTSFQVDATNSIHSEVQVLVTINGTFHSNTTVKAAYVTQPYLDDSFSWGYFLNRIKALNGGSLATIDLSAMNIAFTDQQQTQWNVDAFLDALNEESDKATVKDIYLNLTGINGSYFLIFGSQTFGFTALKNVFIQRHSGANPTFWAGGSVDVSDMAVLSSNTGTLGNSGTVSQWKGYLAYVLDDASHGGVYTGSDPITLNLTASALRIATVAVLGSLETAIAELPARLKARISTILIKTRDNINNLSTNPFGDAFDSTIAEFTQLKAVIIDASLTTTASNKPTFPGGGAFVNATSISKIVY